MDAHEGIRDWLRDTGLHDFEAQPKGPENKVVVRTDVVFPTSRVEVGMSLYRPNTKGGDPRMWPGLLRASGVQPGNLLALVKIQHDRVAIINMSNRPLSRRSTLTVLRCDPCWKRLSGKLAPVSGQQASHLGLEVRMGWPTSTTMMMRPVPNMFRIVRQCSEVSGGSRQAVEEWPQHQMRQRAFQLRRALPGSSRLSSGCARIPIALSRVLFLTSGPGAGKSHATAQAVEGFSLEPGVDTRLAKRAYTYFGEAGRRLVVVNDATIGSGRDKGPVLDKEIADEVGRGSLMLVCVNRGVIVEELAHIRRMGYESAGSVMLEWLVSSNTETDRATESGSAVYAVESRDVTPYLRSAVLRQHNQPVAEIVSVSVDACSFLSKPPELRAPSTGPDGSVLMSTASRRC